jgi:predicted DsbA family dithiol-disulfide isomerase
MADAPDRRRPGVAPASEGTLDVEVWFDFICPWCLIGKRNLEAALFLLGARRPRVVPTMHWNSQPLLPLTPARGLPYVEFYQQRLGGPTPMAMRQAQVLAAARHAGVTIAFDRLEVLPSTLGAHRLVAEAQREAPGGTLPGRVIDALFHEYFVLGNDIGKPAVLQAVAARCGVTGDAEARSLAEPSFQAPGVPFFRFGGTVTAGGAQSPQVLLEAMEQALDLRDADRGQEPGRQKLRTQVRT